MRYMKQNYVTGFDGTRIHYTAFGSGPTLVCSNGFGATPSFFRYIVERFGEMCRVVTWDYRGHGLSFFPETLANVDIPSHAQDLRLVLDDLGIDKAVLIGHQIGVQVSLELARENTDRVAALVAIAGTYGEPMRQMTGSVLGRTLYGLASTVGYQFPLLAETLGEAIAASPRSFEVAKKYLLNASWAKEEDFAEFFGHLGRLDAQLFFAMLRAADRHTADDVVTDLADVPLLLVAGAKDRITPLAAMKRFKELAPHAEMLVVRAASHAVLVEQPELVNLKLEKFLRDALSDGLDGPWGVHAEPPGVRGGRAVR